MLKTATRCLVVLLALALGSTAYGQGVQTGVITGTVVDAEGLVLTGRDRDGDVTGAARCANGRDRHQRCVVVRGLPPGDYAVQFELSGMRTVNATQHVDLGLTAHVDAKLQLATLTENVTVTAELPTLVTTTDWWRELPEGDIDKLAAAARCRASPSWRRA